MLAATIALGTLAGGARGELAASESLRAPAGFIDAGGAHSCALLDDGRVRCWGRGEEGQLGYGNTDTIGDDETPGSVGPVDLGAEQTAVAISAGDEHTCAVLDNGRVRCWGNASIGQLGYGNTDAIGDDETPGSVGPVNLAGELATRGPTKLSARAKPKRDRKAPFKFRLSGNLTGLFVADGATCKGKVRLVAKRGAKTWAERPPGCSSGRQPASIRRR